MAYSLPPLINGKSYEWSDIIINILGLPFAGVTKIMYSEKQNMKNVKGAGDRVVSRVYLDFEPEASVTLLMEELENIQSVAPFGVIQKIPEFDIVVAYLDPSLIPRTHTLRNCRFTNNTREVAAGDGEIACEMELIISHIDWN